MFRHSAGVSGLGARTLGALRAAGAGTPPAGRGAGAAGAAAEAIGRAAATPSLHRHYSDFITTTSDSAPVPRIGTQVLVGSPLERLPWHRDDWFPQFRRKARIRLTPPARRTPPGQASGQPPDFSRRYHPPSVSMSCTGSRRVNGGSLAFVFLIHTCRVMLDVSPTLTTATLNDSRLGWFEAGS